MRNLKDDMVLEVISLMESCSGLLLLHFEIHNTYGVFNPITGEFQLVPNNQHGGPIGLAVDSSTQSYRLVAVDVKQNLTNWEKKVFKFMTFTSSSCMWEEAHEEELVCELPTFLTRNALPIFLRNSMNWLINDGSILAFDLERRRARIIKGPNKTTVDVKFEYDVWFGAVQDSLVFVRAFESEIVIYVYDCVQKKWQILHTIENISRGEGNYFTQNASKGAQAQSTERNV
ncbi:putative F-box protein At1g20800 [Olea europaea var. sylvestris]|uniref:putative F-box protein At1g20800 n=1 Tax=Olea europaea var. sylvestris TaxID=158386 RepID=UPI000C1CEA85|nr:putative F-box protein At1g20800 [Olea europaea var. sylvestris]